MRKTDFTKALTEYFSIYLPTTCGVSPNTTNSYRDTFKQLLLFFQEKKGISANYIELRYLNMELVSEFLDWLETSRHIAVTTRNQRLAAIKAFAHFVQYKFPENIENCVDIINLRPKKYEKALIPFLTEDDLSLLLSQPDASTRQGLRDLTLLALLYDSGARVQELVDLRLKDVRLTHPPMVILTGKGRKVRQVPLMKDITTVFSWAKTRRVCRNMLLCAVFMTMGNRSRGRLPAVRNSTDSASRQCSPALPWRCLKPP